MKDVQCYELFGGIALKNHAFSFFMYVHEYRLHIMTYVSYEVCMYMIIDCIKLHYINHEVCNLHDYHLYATMFYV